MLGSPYIFYDQKDSDACGASGAIIPTVDAECCELKEEKGNFADCHQISSRTAVLSPHSSGEDGCANLVQTDPRLTIELGFLSTSSTTAKIMHGDTNDHLEAANGSGVGPELSQMVGRHHDQEDEEEEILALPSPETLNDMIMKIQSKLTLFHLIITV
ncbi:unnamed protein product [Thelazia callipaeda]|uniref:Pecanex-like protein n=1 Tax=Thelazia callipaeda TaxID=103827 RepID=A0A0N5CWG9_THECL|nr:unnamed protein product [Thelazia callipaeda]